MTYVWLAQGLLMTIYIWGWYEVALRVRSGDVATDLQRPVDFQAYWLAQDLGRALYHALFRGVPPFVVGALVFDVLVPGEPVTWLAFVVSVALAVVVSFAFRFLFNLAAFWLLDYRGAGDARDGRLDVLLRPDRPARVLPDWLEALAWALPFAAMVQAPIEVFLGHAEGRARRACSRSRRSGRSRLLAPRPAVSRPGRGSWWSRVGEARRAPRVYRRLDRRADPLAAPVPALVRAQPGRGRR